VLLAGYLRHREGPENHGEGRFYNSFAVLDKDLELVTTYDKFHLVPFGEYIPLANILHIAPFVALDGFDSGTGPQTIHAGALPSFSPLICYEIIFPGAITAPGDRPQWIVNITNDGWYGDSPGPYQHFAQTRFRAIEEGLPVVRAANTGISGVIDPYGRVLSRTAIFEESAHPSLLPLPAPRPTLYSRVKDMPFFILLILLCGTGIALRRTGHAA